MRLAFVLLVAPLACTACSSTAGPAGDNATSDAGVTPVVDAQDNGFVDNADAAAVPILVQVSGVLTAVCASADGCHGAGAGMLGLSAGNVFGPLINVPSWEMPELLRVKPFDPAQSYVYRKLACEGGIDGGCMPLGGSITPTLLQAFHDWIEAGAPTR